MADGQSNSPPGASGPPAGPTFGFQTGAFTVGGEPGGFGGDGGSILNNPSEPYFNMNTNRPGNMWGRLDDGTANYRGVMPGPYAPQPGEFPGITRSSLAGMMRWGNRGAIMNAMALQAASAQAGKAFMQGRMDAFRLYSMQAEERRKALIDNQVEEFTAIQEAKALVGTDDNGQPKDLDRYHQIMTRIANHYQDHAMLAAIGNGDWAGVERVNQAQDNSLLPLLQIEKQRAEIESERAKADAFKREGAAVGAEASPMAEPPAQPPDTTAPDSSQPTAPAEPPPYSDQGDLTKPDVPTAQPGDNSTLAPNTSGQADLKGLPQYASDAMSDADTLPANAQMAQAQQGDSGVGQLPRDPTTGAPVLTVPRRPPPGTAPSAGPGFGAQFAPNARPFDQQPPPPPAAAAAPPPPPPPKPLPPEVPQPRPTHSTTLPPLSQFLPPPGLMAPGFSVARLNQLAMQYLSDGKDKFLDTKDPFRIIRNEAVGRRASQIESAIQAVLNRRDLGPDQKLQLIKQIDPYIGGNAEGIVNRGEPLPRSTYSRYSQLLAAIIPQIKPDFNAQDYNWVAKYQNDFAASGYAGRQIDSANNLARAVINVIRTARLLPNEIPPASAYDAWVHGTFQGDPRWSNFFQAWNTFAMEQVRLARGGTGSESDIKRQVEEIKPSSTKEQIFGGLVYLMDDAIARLTTEQRRWMNGPLGNKPMPGWNPDSMRVFNAVRNHMNNQGIFEGADLPKAEREWLAGAYTTPPKGTPPGIYKAYPKEGYGLPAVVQLNPDGSIEYLGVSHGEQ
jgi:hypothetical protein